MTTKNKAVYAVSTGTYSDYEVQAVFTTREKAQQYIDTVNEKLDKNSSLCNSNFNEVEELPLDPPYAQQLKDGYSLFSICMLTDGTVIGHEQTGVTGYPLEDVRVHRHALHKSKYPGEKCVYATVLAKDLKHAIKITNEHRLRLIAQDAWSEL